MDRQGIVTEEGVNAFRDQGNIAGSMAVHVHIIDNKVRVDFSIVDDAGVVLATWDGVDVIDDSRVTWCFAESGTIKISMDPYIVST